MEPLAPSPARATSDTDSENARPDEPFRTFSESSIEHHLRRSTSPANIAIPPSPGSMELDNFEGDRTLSPSQRTPTRSLPRPSRSGSQQSMQFEHFDPHAHAQDSETDSSSESTDYEMKQDRINLPPANFTQPPSPTPSMQHDHTNLPPANFAQPPSPTPSMQQPQFQYSQSQQPYGLPPSMHPLQFHHPQSQQPHAPPMQPLPGYPYPYYNPYMFIPPGFQYPPPPAGGRGRGQPNPAQQWYHPAMAMPMFPGVQPQPPRSQSDPPMDLDFRPPHESHNRETQSCSRKEPCWAQDTKGRDRQRQAQTGRRRRRRR